MTIGGGRVCRVFVTCQCEMLSFELVDKVVFGRISVWLKEMRDVLFASRLLSLKN